MSVWGQSKMRNSHQRSVRTKMHVLPSSPWIPGRRPPGEEAQLRAPVGSTQAHMDSAFTVSASPVSPPELEQRKGR